MACIPIKNVKIAREPGTCISRGLCYLEANNVSEASRLFSVLTQDTLEIEGRVGMQINATQFFKILKQLLVP